jgi:predicted aspartyl protease
MDQTMVASTMRKKLTTSSSASTSFVNGMQMEAVWDTGASESFITPEAARKAKATLHRLAKPMT